MPALVAGIHVFLAEGSKQGVEAGTSSAMTPEERPNVIGNCKV